MIFSWLALVILGLLVGASWLDLKYKAVPSVFLTAGIFVALMVNPENLLTGVICLVFSLMIRDLINDWNGLTFGMADIKIFVIFGLLITNFSSLMVLFILFLIYQFVYTLMWRWKIGDEKEMPFIPCLLMVYISLLIMGMVA